MKKGLLFAFVVWFTLSACGLSSRILESTDLPAVDLPVGSDSEPEPMIATESQSQEQSGQNDADSNKDAGNEDASALMVQPGAGYRGQVGGDDPLDIYRVRSAPFEIVSVTVTADAANSEPLNVYMQNTGGEYSSNYDILPGSSNTLVLAANQEQFNNIYFSSWDMAAYTFEVVIVPENDANTGADVKGLIGEALPIELGQEINGASVRLIGQGGHDRDCYAVDLTATGTLSVLLTSPSGQPFPESFASIELYGNNGDYVWGTSTSASGSETLVTVIDEPERYVLCASAYEYYPIGYYSFVANLNP